MVLRAIPLHTDFTLKQSGPDSDRQCQTNAKQRGGTITSEDTLANLTPSDTSGPQCSRRADQHLSGHLKSPARNVQTITTLVLFAIYPLLL